MKDHIVFLLKEILIGMGVTDVIPDVEISDAPVHGEYTTNVAMQVTKILKKPPMEIALQVAEEVKRQKAKGKSDGSDRNKHQEDQTDAVKIAGNTILQAIDRVEVAPPGFINIFLTEASLSTELARVLEEKEGYGKAKRLTGRDIMMEYGDPNTHKAFHIGHLRNITIGESVVRLLEHTGNKVLHTSYQGDVGMHIAKAIYGLVRLLIAAKDTVTVNDLAFVFDKLSTLEKEPLNKRIELLGKAYMEGNKGYEEEPLVKTVIGEINKNIYSKGSNEVFDRYYEIYRMTRQWSLDYFDLIYKRLGTRYDRNYFESDVYESGKQNVLNGEKKGIFVKSEGAIIFPGETYGLNNRVFITSEGNPTYEGKDMGLGPLQYSDLKGQTGNPTKVIRVVGPEQAGYFAVVFEAQSQLFPELRNKFYHLIAGWVKLKHGKMSSRSGNVVTGESLLDSVKQKIYDILDQNESKKSESSESKSSSEIYTKEEKVAIAEATTIAAVKYSFLRVSTTQEIAFDIDESINFDGDSGPYLLYTYARCKSVLRKAEIKPSAISHQPSARTKSESGKLKAESSSLNPEEHTLARLISQFPDVVAGAAATLSPSDICTYLNRLASAFNVFYAKHTILGTQDLGLKTHSSPTSYVLRPTSVNLRLALTAATAQVLSNGLHLLGISTVERM